MRSVTIITAPLQRPCLAATHLVHDGPCTCLGSRLGAPAYFPTLPAPRRTL